MKSNYIKKLNMIRVLLAYLEEQKETWKDLPAFAEAVAWLTEQKIAIEEEARKQEEITPGISDDKELKKSDMVKLAVKLCSAGKAWAAKVKNQELKTGLNVSYSKLLKRKDQECFSFCKNINLLVSPVIGNFADYGVIAGDLTAFNAAIDRFHAVISAPQAARTEVKNATGQIDVLFDEADAVLRDTLDAIALVLKENHAGFYAGYQNARFIGGWKERKAEPKENKVNE